MNKINKFSLSISLFSPISLLIVQSCSQSIPAASMEQINEIKDMLDMNNYFDLYEYAKEKNLIKTFFNNNKNNQTDQIFMPYFKDWFDKLSISPFNTNENNKIINLYCDSQRQAMSLYLQSWGHYWNVPLHHQEEPINTTIDKKYIHTIPHNDFENQNKIEIRGKDYKKIEDALIEATSPISFTTYHGVEFMEVEFYNQLQEYIIENNDGSYDYKNCKDKVITTYGFISSTLNREIAYRYSDGFNWTDNNKKQPPLKEPVMFKIKVPKETKGVAYVSGFELIKQLNFSISDNEQQILFNIGTQFKIENISKEGDVTIFEMIVNQ